MFFLLVVVLFVSVARSSCVFTNWDFTQPLGTGWTILESNPAPHIDSNPYLVLGDMTTESTGNSSVYQDFTISSCAQQLNISFSPRTKDNSYLNDRQQVLVVNPATGDVLARIFDTLLGFNHQPADNWFMINCNVCDGTCGGVNLNTVGVSPLRLLLRVHQKGNPMGIGGVYQTPTMMSVKHVCLQ